jgi:hypothetical protein
MINKACREYFENKKQKSEEENKILSCHKDILQKSRMTYKKANEEKQKLFEEGQQTRLQAAVTVRIHKNSFHHPSD